MIFGIKHEESEHFILFIFGSFSHSLTTTSSLALLFFAPIHTKNMKIDQRLSIHPITPLRPIMV